MTRHIFLSPHLDDIILSCSGYLAQTLQQGQTCQVITIFCQQPDTSQPVSPFAGYLHKRWGNLNEVFLARRREDTAALNYFNLQPIWLSYLDCIYRGQPEQEIWYYHSRDAIFGSIHPAEADLPRELAQNLRSYLPSPAETILYTPLTIGNHVDHQLTQRAALILAEAGYTLQFYEDYPYIQRDPAELERALNLLAPNPNDRQPKMVWLSQAQLDLKQNAIAAYASQMDSLFGGEQAMRQRVAEFALSTGQGQPAERLWRLKIGDKSID